MLSEALIWKFAGLSALGNIQRTNWKNIEGTKQPLEETGKNGACIWEKPAAKERWLVSGDKFVLKKQKNYYWRYPIQMYIR